MKLIYATSLTFPSGLANRLQTLAMAREFNKKLKESFYLGVGKIGNGVELNKDIQIFDFNITKSYVLAFKYFKFIKKHNIKYIYCREPRLMLFLILYCKLFFMKCKFIYEMHELAERSMLDKFINKVFSKMVDYMVFITKNLRDLYIKKYKFFKEKTLVAPDGVDLEIFNLDLTKEKAREQKNLPQNKKIIGFFGRFKTMSMDKGLEVILNSLKLLEEDVLLLAMGGKKRDIEYYSKRAEELGVSDKVIFVEHFNQNEVAIRQKACDILLMPFPNIKHYAYYMSPLKMFEYMASKRPIIATSLPSVKEVLNEENAILIKPDNSEDLAMVIKRVLESEDLVKKTTTKAFQDVKQYTWERRVNKIIDFFKCE